jgi:hypothetical protein
MKRHWGDIPTKMQSNGGCNAIQGKIDFGKNPKLTSKKIVWNTI